MCTLYSQAVAPLFNQPGDILFEDFMQVYEHLRTQCGPKERIPEADLTGPIGANPFLNEATIVIVAVLLGADELKILKNPCQSLVSKEVAVVKKRWKKAYPDQEGKGSQRRLIQRVMSLSVAIRRLWADPMLPFAFCALHFASTYSPDCGRTVKHLNNVGEVHVIVGVLERLQTEHSRLKKIIAGRLH